MGAEDLFEAEAATLARAIATLAKGNCAAEEYQTVLADLVKRYERMMREMRRLIDRSDRTELELNALNGRLRHLTCELDYKARHDNLTGTLNRGAVFECAAQYLKQSSLSLIVLDIDFFKRINDDFGHPTGDAVIKELIARLRFVLQDIGAIGRVGGEEFTILLPGMDLEEAARLAGLMCDVIGAEVFECLPVRHVTASFGVAWCPVSVDFEELYATADSALYHAKHGGRNRVEIASATCNVSGETNFL